MKTISRNIDETDVELVKKLYLALGEYYDQANPPDVETMLKGIDTRVFLNLDSIQVDLIRKVEKAKKSTEYAALDEAVEIEVAKKVPIKPEPVNASLDALAVETKVV